MATFSERVVLSVKRIVICPFLVLVISHFGSEGRVLVMIVSVPGHCLPFYLT